LADIETANNLANDVLGRSLDELPPQTRRLLDRIDAMVREHCTQHHIKQEDYRFSRRDVRIYCGWSDTQVKKHIKRLEELEYVLVHRGTRGQSFVYELLYNGEGHDGQSFMMKLIDINQLKHQYDAKKDPQFTKKDPSSTPQVSPKGHLCVDTKNNHNDLFNNHLDAIPTFINKKTDQGTQNKNASYRKPGSLAAKH